LQEVDDCHAVVGGDEDFLRHSSFLSGFELILFRTGSSPFK
jgi:hypothetical protein